jgi:hypothetical protein
MQIKKKWVFSSLTAETNVQTHEPKKKLTYNILFGLNIFP